VSHKYTHLLFVEVTIEMAWSVRLRVRSNESLRVQSATEADKTPAFTFTHT